MTLSYKQELQRFLGGSIAAPECRAPGYYWVQFMIASDWSAARWDRTDWFYDGIEGKRPAPLIIGPKIKSPQ